MKTDYTLMTIPAYELAVWKDGELVNKDAPLLWSNALQGNNEPPAIGTVINVNMNGLGKATVIGYFQESNFLGLRVRLHDAPAWHKKQRKGDPVAMIFGTEYKPLDQA